MNESILYLYLIYIENNIYIYYLNEDMIYLCMLYNQERIIPAIKGCYNHFCYMISLHRVARRA